MDKILKDYLNKYNEEKYYWYIPKGRTISYNTLETIKNILIVLKNFESKKWSLVKSECLRILESKGIIKHRREDVDIEAKIRMDKVVLSTLGFAYIDDDESVYITDVGKKFLEEDILNIAINQLFKYQIYNPTISSNEHKCIKLFPFRTLLNFLIKLDGNFLNRAEFILFISRCKSDNDIDYFIELINSFRNLKRKTKIDLINKFESNMNNLSKIYKTIKQDFTYILNFLTLHDVISYNKGGDILSSKIYIKANSLNLARKIKKDLDKKVFIEFENVKDWMSYYGDLNKLISYEDAIEYYSIKSDLDKLSEILKTTPLKIKRDLGIEDEDYIKEIVDEELIESYLEKNIWKISPELRLVENGRGYSTPAGEIDLLAIDKQGRYVVIELKKGRTSDKVIGQISRYIGWVKHNFQQEYVKGIIIAKDYDKKFIWAFNAYEGFSSIIDLYKYTIKISFNNFDIDSLSN